MLSEVYCDKFNDKIVQPIKFNKGLNVVLGGTATDNSTGKTTMLLIIDFCFGGNEIINHTFFEKDKNYEFKFCHKIENNKNYYVRNILEYNKVQVCDENYVIKNKIDVENFRNDLKNLYNKNNAFSFRKLHDKFMRFGEVKKIDYNNYLYSYGKDRDNVEVIEDLYLKYKEIEELKQKLDEESEIIKAYKKISNSSSFSDGIINKKKYNELLNELNNINDELENIDNKDLLNSYNDDLVKVLCNDDKIEYLKEQISLIENELNKKYTSSTIDNVIKYFPDINIERLELVESFHSELTQILNDELQLQKKDMLDELEKLTKERNELVQKKNLNNNTKIENIIQQSETLSKIIRKNEINQKILNYNKFNENVENKKTIQSNITTIENNNLPVIKNTICSKMSEINRQIFNGITKIPKFDINGMKCIFSKVEDDGEGCLYVGMIVFDLTILNTTTLNYFIHDKAIMNGIDKKKWGDIILMYNKYSVNKQSFIVIDDTEMLDEDVKSELDKSTIIKLTSECKLFKDISSEN